MFLVGLIFEAMVAVQTRLLADRHPRRLALGVWTAVGCVVWCYVVRQVVLQPEFILWYAAGAVIGVVAASYLPLRKHG